MRKPQFSWQSRHEQAPSVVAAVESARPDDKRPETDRNPAPKAGFSFDVVMVMSLLHLLRHLSAGLRRIHDLVPGGLFISKTPCIGDRGVGVRIVIPQLRAVALPLT